MNSTHLGSFLLSGFLALTALSMSACSPRSGHIRFQHPGLKDHSGTTHTTAPGVGGHWFKKNQPTHSAAAYQLRNRVTASATSAVGKRQVHVQGKAYRRDCSGVVRGIYAHAGLPLGGAPITPNENDVSIIYRWVQENGSIRKSHPLPGDLVFFDDTYDRNGDQRENDPLSHIGIVEEILSDGTVVFVHHVAGGILRYRMNLRNPKTTTEESTGKRRNHILRRANKDIDSATTAELFVGYGTIILDGEARFAYR